MENKRTGRSCPFEVGGQVWLEKDGEVFFHQLTVELLEGIQKHGSIAQAAKELDLSYQKAWTLIDRANRNARLPLVQRSRGGTDGGGARVTREGERIIGEFRQLLALFERFVANSLETFDY